METSLLQITGNNRTTVHTIKIRFRVINLHRHNVQSMGKFLVNNSPAMILPTFVACTTNAQQIYICPLMSYHIIFQFNFIKKRQFDWRNVISFDEIMKMNEMSWFFFQLSFLLDSCERPYANRKLNL